MALLPPGAVSTTVLSPDRLVVSARVNAPLSVIAPAKPFSPSPRVQVPLIPIWRFSATSVRAAAGSGSLATVG